MASRMKKILLSMKKKREDDSDGTDYDQGYLRKKMWVEMLMTMQKERPAFESMKTGERRSFSSLETPKETMLLDFDFCFERKKDQSQRTLKMEWYQEILREMQLMIHSLFHFCHHRSSNSSRLRRHPCWLLASV
jgi:hypothetical protein